MRKFSKMMGIEPRGTRSRLLQYQQLGHDRTNKGVRRNHQFGKTNFLTASILRVRKLPRYAIVLPSCLHGGDLRIGKL